MVDVKERKKRHWLKWVIIIICLFLVIIFLLAAWFFTPWFNSRPQVRIVQPVNRLAIQSGDIVILKVEGTSRKGFSKLVFNVDGLFKSQDAGLDWNAKDLNITFPWYSSQPGVHKLSVIAYDSLGAKSRPSDVLVMVNPQGIPQISHVSQPNPDEDQADGSQGSEADQMDGGQGSESDGSSSEGGLGNQEGRLSEEEERANLEWFNNEVDENDDFPLDIRNLELDEIPLITAFEIDTNRAGDQTSGSFTIKATDDLGLISITFALANLDDPMHPFTKETVCGGAQTCVMTGDFQLAQGGWLLTAQAADTSGQVSDLHSHQIHILEGGDPQGIGEGDGDEIFSLDPNIPWDEVELIEVPTDDIGVPMVSEYGCSGQIVYLDVPYTYASEHGEDVYLEVNAEIDHIMVAVGQAKIQPGVGVVRIEMEPIAPDMAEQTNELELYFRTGADYFYTETTPLTITWPIPEPDLTIIDVQQAEALVNVSIKNMGCTSARGFELGFNLADNQVLNQPIDQVLSPGATYTWEGLINPNLFSRGFETVVDPNNAIVEIDENNNQFTLAPISIAYIEVYRVDIHDISEGWLRGDKGEFELEVEVNDRYLRSPAGDSFYWSLGKGTFMIQNSPEPIFLHPELRWDEDLWFAFYGWENDDLTNDPLGHVFQVYSYDMFMEGNWKLGGEFSALSDYKFYTVYWRIVLNDRY